MSDLELAVRGIEQIIPDLSDEKLNKWHGILTTALLKIEGEMRTVAEHICSVCLAKEYGHRDSLPVGWREHGDLKLCFGHEDKEIADALERGLKAEAPEPVKVDDVLAELMAEL